MDDVIGVIVGPEDTNNRTLLLIYVIVIISVIIIVIALSLSLQNELHKVR